MTKQVVPLGFCKDCRFARSWDPGALPPAMLQDFPLACHALPPNWMLIQKPSKLVAAEGSSDVQLILQPNFKRLVDHCSLYEPVPG